MSFTGDTKTKKQNKQKSIKFVVFYFFIPGLVKGVSCHSILPSCGPSRAWSYIEKKSKNIQALLMLLSLHCILKNRVLIIFNLWFSKLEKLHSFKERSSRFEETRCGYLGFVNYVRTSQLKARYRLQSATLLLSPFISQGNMILQVAFRKTLPDYKKSIPYRKKFKDLLTSTPQIREND